MFELCKDKKQDIMKMEDENIHQKGKVKSLEKSLKAKDKKIQSDKEKIDNARDTIAKLESRNIISYTKLEAVETRIDVGEYFANNYRKDENENLFESLSAEPKSRSDQNYKLSTLPLEQLSPVRGGSATRALPGTPSSPHTPPCHPFLLLP